MKKLELLLGTATILLAVATASRADQAQAAAAYDAKQFARCGQLYLEHAASLPRTAVADPLYKAASCYALDGDPDKAFATLEQWIAVSSSDVAASDPVAHVALLQAAADLASLHSDPRWPKLIDALIASLQARMAALETPVAEAALRRELLTRVREDQAVRASTIKRDPADKSLAAQVEAVDRENTARMKEIVAEHGWPGKSLVGEDGARAAWLLVQHADLDLAFQKACLAKLELAVKSGEAGPREYAYLVDRVAVGDRGKQVYGTQFSADGVPVPIEDEAHVDERRQTVGLPSMEVRKAQMSEMRDLYGAAK